MRMAKLTRQERKRREAHMKATRRYLKQINKINEEKGFWEQPNFFYRFLAVAFLAFAISQTRFVQSFIHHLLGS